MGSSYLRITELYEVSNKLEALGHSISHHFREQYWVSRERSRRAIKTRPHSMQPPGAEIPTFIMLCLYSGCDFSLPSVPAFSYSQPQYHPVCFFEKSLSTLHKTNKYKEPKNNLEKEGVTQHGPGHT